MYGNNTNHTQILGIIKKNIFPHTFCVSKIARKTFSADLRKPCLKTGESLSLSKKLILFMRKSLATLLRQDEKSPLTWWLCLPMPTIAHDPMAHHLLTGPLQLTIWGYMEILLRQHCYFSVVCL